jgi:signal transduction histidine kinase
MLTAPRLFLLLWTGGVFCVGAAGEPEANGTASESTRPLTRIGEFRSLSRADFNRGRPVRITGTVTLVDRGVNRLVLQDGTNAMAWQSDAPLDATLLGKRVLLECASSVPYVENFPEYPERPAGHDVQDVFEAPSNWGDYHLTRMAGYLRPPVTGAYTFWIASDNSSELWLSPDDDPTRVRRICYVQEGFWTNPREWTRLSSQQSEPIQLRADRTYYIEALQEQLLLNDHLAVAWQGPGMERAVIEGRYLTPWTSEMAVATNGVLREYWTNYSAGNISPVVPSGPVEFGLTGKNARFTVLGEADWPEPEKIDPGAVMSSDDNYRWVQAEGILKFVGADGDAVELELVSGPKRFVARVDRWQDDLPRPDRNWRVRVEGVCVGVHDANGMLDAGLIRVPTAQNVQFLEPAGMDADRSTSVRLTETNVIPTFGGFYIAWGVVTFDDRVFGNRYLYVQDVNGGLLISQPDRVAGRPFQVGQWVELGGYLSPTRSAPALVPIRSSLLGSAHLPSPTPFIGLADSTFRSGQWTEVSGVVRSVNRRGTLALAAKRGLISVWLPDLRTNDFPVDSALRIRGVLSLDVPESPMVLVPSRRFVEVDEEWPREPFSLPLQAIAQLDAATTNALSVHRVRVHGIVTYTNENSFFLQDDSGAVRVQTHEAPAVRTEEWMEAAGFPEANGSFRFLADSVCRASGGGTSSITTATLLLNEPLTSHYNGELVHVRANLLAQKTRGSAQILEMQAGQRGFEAVLAAGRGQLPPMRAGSLIELTGVCVANLISSPNDEVAGRENPSLASVQILVRSPRDVVVLSGPPWWTWKKVVALIGILLGVLAATVLRIQMLRKRFERRQSAQLEFSRQILQSQESERRRIAANLHDSLGQNLLVIKNQARLGLQPVLDASSVRQCLDQISGMASQAIEEVRQITHDLRPYVLDQLGLTQTLRAIIRRASENCPIVFASHVDDIDGLFGSESEIHIYRIVQEGLNNVIKHSGATEAAVVIKRQPDLLTIAVRDNGRGFTGNSGVAGEFPEAGFGLSGVGERARILGGKVIWESQPDKGFGLTIEIPLPDKTSPHET